MKTYYVNSETGSDANAGTSAGSALASLAAVNNLKLKAGDVVLFSAGTEYHGQLDIKYSGTAEKPITFGSYGAGEPPVLSGGSVGIYGSKTSNIVIENLAIEKTAGNAVYAGNASNWTLNNVTVTDTGTPSKAGSISFQSSSNITITNSHVSGTSGDGVWMLNVKGAVLTGNSIGQAKGHNADAVQINGSSDIVVKNNVLDMTGENGSAKGVLVIVDAKNALVDGNTVVGGGFGISAMGQNITIKNNDISDYKGYSWSYGIGLGQQVDAKNYVISNNHIHDGVWGVAVTASGTDKLVRSGIEISGNHFDDLSEAALKVDRPASGSFHGNEITETVSRDIYISTPIKSSGTFLTTASQVLVPVKVVLPPALVIAKADAITVPVPSQAPTTAPSKAIVAVNDVLKFSDAHHLSLSGNVLANDHSDNDVLSLRNLNGTSFKNGSTMDIEGKYGVLHIESDGDYSFTVKTDRIDHLSGTLKESFQYKVSNGSVLDTGYISIEINADHITKSIAADQFI
ncbi:right-handed parallel beta-helix repeat-containing protein [uncultured Agrobacterium sp.]|uniref:right-handed parallel beta-helix repeat-containing protein n=1 Tax=uncultured Agrobacterium sp. TaxID=157277 RepID=UPI0025F39867|nr:right-handed parallel beta-helix repeat-containing protein [uncultured Agrobacterium sp.]